MLKNDGTQWLASDPSLTEATARLDAPVIVLGETIADRTVTLTYSVGNVRGVATCEIDTERDDRGPFDYVWSVDCDHTEPRVVELLEAAALEAWERRPSASDQWFSDLASAMAVAA